MAIKQKFIEVAITTSTETVYKAQCKKFVDALAECGFGEWTYTYSSYTCTLAPSEGANIYGNTNTIGFRIQNDCLWCITYDDETEFFALVCSNYTIPNNAPSFFFGRISSGGKTIYGTTSTSNINGYTWFNISSRNPYSDGTGTYVLTPLYHCSVGLMADVYVCQNNLNVAGNIVTDGVNRFLSLGTIFYKKIN